MLEKFHGEKRKQQIILGIAVAIGIGIIFLLSTLFGSKKNTQVKKEIPNVEIVDDRKIEEEPFKKIYGEKIGVLEKQIEDLQKEMKMMNELLKEQTKNQNIIPYEGSFIQGKSDIDENTSQIKIKETGPKIITSGQNVNLPSANTPITYQNQQVKQEQRKISVQVLDNLIAFEGSVSETQETDTQKLEQNKDIKKEDKPKTIETTIPAGSFVRAVLLSGLDAPTNGSATRNPHPVLFKIINKAILPNKWKMNIKDCFLIGTGYGDLSSERAYIRLERLSCTKADGSIISKTVEGYVSGEDGKNGLKGRVVSKQGTLLARTLLAGFLEGVSRAFTYSQQTLLISPQGATQTVNPQNAFQYAGLSGVSEAAKKLADFYMNLVNKTFPVIEILPGRKVDIVFLKDIQLED